MHHYIPKNLDIHRILVERPPCIDNFEKDILLHFVHLISALPACNKEIVTDDGYVRLYSKLLQKVARNYTDYFRYLIATKILESNESYCPKHSKGYRFTKHFAEIDIKGIEVENIWLSNRLRKSQALTPIKKKKYAHLIKWYSGLQINETLALDFILEDFNRKRNNPAFRDKDRFGNEKHPFSQYKSASVNIGRLSTGDYALSIDDNVHRLHSVLSNMRKEIRHCITFKGQQLVSVDIKNSQPYLSTAILCESFWDWGRKLHPFYNYLNIKDIGKAKVDSIFKAKHSIDSYIMLCKSAESQSASDLQLFRQIASKGEFYEYLMKAFEQDLGINGITREQAKKMVFQVLFTDNRFLGQKDAEPKRLFKKLFPTVYELFRRIKRHGNELLPCLLQSIESYLILEVITKRIAREKPGLPIFTIHDSIVTTLGNEQYVSQVMVDELTRAIGLAPNVEFEYWRAGLLTFKDGTQFQPSRKIAA
jgi:hypothetical protein